MFKIGQKVVCIDDTPRKHGDTLLKKGEIYTLKDVFENINGLAVLLVELNPSPSTVGFYANRFRPLQDKWAENVLSEAIKEAKEEVIEI